MIFFVFPSYAFGEVFTQTITLNPGWNAIYLEVHPEFNECKNLFKDLPVKSVWAWDYRFSSVQYVIDPEKLLPEQQEWLVYFPQESKKSFLSSLYTLQGGRSYLIELDANGPINMTIQGSPVMNEFDWKSNSFNLVGFHVDPNFSPTFSSYFRFSPAHNGEPIYKLERSGKWVRVKPDEEIIKSGCAYWVFCDGFSRYNGSFATLLPQNSGLYFNRFSYEQHIKISNNTSTESMVELKMCSSLPSNNTDKVPQTGIKILYWNKTKWEDFPSVLEISVSPESDIPIRIAVKIDQQNNTSDQLFKSYLSVSDDKGLRIFIPLTVDISFEKQVGLWTGMAAINKVSCPTDIDDPNQPRPTASDFLIRLIVHIDKAGQTRLLQQAIIIEKEPEPSDLDTNEKQLVLIANHNLIPNYISSSSLHNNNFIGLRISSAAFAFENSIPMTWQSGLLTTEEFELDYNHPLNPFKHKYHPDHDNLDAYFEQTLCEGSESFSITRTIELELKSPEPDENARQVSDYSNSLINPGEYNFFKNQLSGIYHETIKGVHKKPLYVEGTFNLQLISSIPVLSVE